MALQNSENTSVCSLTPFYGSMPRMQRERAVKTHTTKIEALFKVVDELDGGFEIMAKTPAGPCAPVILSDKS